MQALMGYFLSNTVQQNLGSWTLLPLPKALLAAGRQAVSSMIARPSNQNQTRGGYAIAPASFSNPGGPQSSVTMQADQHTLSDPVHCMQHARYCVHCQHLDAGNILPRVTRALYLNV